MLLQAKHIYINDVENMMNVLDVLGNLKVIPLHDYWVDRVENGQLAGYLVFNVYLSIRVRPYDPPPHPESTSWSRVGG